MHREAEAVGRDSPSGLAMPRQCMEKDPGYELGFFICIHDMQGCAMPLIPVST